MKKSNLFLTALAAGIFIFFSCKKDNSTTTSLPTSSTDSLLHGAFITNEGKFTGNNGSVSFLDTKTSILTNNVFEQQNNGVSLGDVVQSFGTAGKKGFIVVNNSQKAVIVSMKTFKSLGTINNLSYPRYFFGISDTKGYLTNGNMQGKVYVIDVVNQKIKDSITVGNGPENLIK
jgi:hypothetical protein